MCVLMPRCVSGMVQQLGRLLVPCSPMRGHVQQGAKLGLAGDHQVTPTSESATLVRGHPKVNTAGARAAAKLGTESRERSNWGALCMGAA